MVQNCELIFFWQGINKEIDGSYNALFKFVKKTILCFVDHYLPGYKAGGPIQSIVNLVENLGDEFEFYIICNDRDQLDRQPYANVKID